MVEEAVNEEDEILKEQEEEKQKQDAKDLEQYDRGEVITNLPQKVRDIILYYLTDLYHESLIERQQLDPGSPADFRAYGTMVAVDKICKELKIDMDVYKEIKEELLTRLR